MYITRSLAYAAFAAEAVRASPDSGMDREWNEGQPIYRQLREKVVAMILDGVLKAGDPIPSVRSVAAEYRVNPLTVLKAYEELVEGGLAEMRRGLGLFVLPGARDLLLKGERQRFLSERWPEIFRDHPSARPHPAGAGGRRAGYRSGNFPKGVLTSWRA